jgi:hypothetical protein
MVSIPVPLGYHKPKCVVPLIYLKIHTYENLVFLLITLLINHHCKYSKLDYNLDLSLGILFLHKNKNLGLCINLRNACMKLGI